MNFGPQDKLARGSNEMNRKIGMRFGLKASEEVEANFVKATRYIEGKKERRRARSL